MKIPVIEFVDFTFQYHAQSRPTLHRINLTIYEGEKVLIVGPSGSGKSTLAHCMNGLIPFFYTGEMSGSMKIKGKELKDQSIAELSDTVGTVLQDPDGQFVGLTVAEDIVFKLENDAIPQAEMTDRLAAAARKVDIEQYLESSPHALSGGQKQKTTLGGVLVNDVDILLFDEPLASLDPYTGKRTIELIDRIHLETGKTVVIIEHRLEDVLHRSVDRIIVVRDGQAQADLPAAELLSSNILVEAGIREPLYITALKYAGCSITPEIHPEHVDTIRLDSCTPRLQEWYRSLNNSSETADFPVILELKDISFGYEKNQPILHHVSLRIGKGEIVSIAGRNGAGKSTISKLICGFYRPSSGTILLNGRDIRSDSIKERADRIGFVMQNPNHMLSKTLIYDEVALGLKLRGVPEEAIRERVHEVLKVCGLYAFRSWPVSALSYGQKKRVTIASILVLSPEVIILDEPTAGQDYRHYNEMMEFLLTLNRQGITIIMITHDMHLMLEYAQRTIVLSEGTKIADDSPVHVLTNPGVAEAAHLKMTSVHELAIRAGVDRPEEFVSRFIAYDRGMRGQ
ncbi:putative HMP/thiamine import ATP-binding protein YkoD [compost metagenome]